MKTTTSIGGRCKRGDTLSRAVLITRELSWALKPKREYDTDKTPLCFLFAGGLWRVLPAEIPALVGLSTRDFASWRSRHMASSHHWPSRKPGVGPEKGIKVMIA